MMKMNQGEFFKEFVQRTRYNYEVLVRGEQYNITALVNSIIGLLIFPKEIKVDIHSNSDLEQVLLEMVGYLIPPYDTEENKKCEKIVQHMRNAVAHANILFEGESPSMKSKEQEVKYVIFKDFRILDYMQDIKEQNFELNLPVQLLEKFLLTYSEQFLTQKNVLTF